MLSQESVPVDLLGRRLCSSAASTALMKNLVSQESDKVIGEFGIDIGTGEGESIILDMITFFDKANTVCKFSDDERKSIGTAATAEQAAGPEAARAIASKIVMAKVDSLLEFIETELGALSELTRSGEGVFAEYVRTRVMDFIKPLNAYLNAEIEAVIADALTAKFATENLELLHTVETDHDGALCKLTGIVDEFEVELRETHQAELIDITAAAALKGGPTAATTTYREAMEKIWAATETEYFHELIESVQDYQPEAVERILERRARAVHQLDRAVEAATISALNAWLKNQTDGPCEKIMTYEMALRPRAQVISLEAGRRGGSWIAAARANATSPRAGGVGLCGPAIADVVLSAPDLSNLGRMGGTELTGIQLGRGVGSLGSLPAVEAVA